MKHHVHIFDLLSRQTRFLPRDQFLFPENPDDLLNKSSTVDLGNWILTRKTAILQSEKQAQAQALATTHPIHHWFRPILQTRFNKAKQWFQDKLLFEPFNKKRRHKPSHAPPKASIPAHQQSIKRYFSLMHQTWFPLSQPLLVVLSFESAPAL